MCWEEVLFQFVDRTFHWTISNISVRWRIFLCTSIFACPCFLKSLNKLFIFLAERLASQCNVCSLQGMNVKIWIIFLTNSGTKADTCHCILIPKGVQEESFKGHATCIRIQHGWNCLVSSVIFYIALFILPGCANVTLYMQMCAWRILRVRVCRYTYLHWQDFSSCPELAISQGSWSEPRWCYSCEVNVRSLLVSFKLIYRRQNHR